MIAVIRTVHGNFNVLGTRDDGFVLQGNLNRDELKDLLEKGQEALDLDAHLEAHRDEEPTVAETQF